LPRIEEAVLYSVRKDFIAAECTLKIGVAGAPAGENTRAENRQHWEDSVTRMSRRECLI